MNPRDKKKSQEILCRIYNAFEQQNKHKWGKHPRTASFKGGGITSSLIEHKNEIPIYFITTASLPK